MLWPKDAYLLGIGALLVTAFAGVMGIQRQLNAPRPVLPICQVEKAKYELIQQCKAGSKVIFQGKVLGEWSGVELKK